MMVPQYWVRADEGIRGPLPLDRVREEALNGTLRADHEVSTDRTKWTPAAEMEGLEFALPEQPAENASQLEEEAALGWLLEADAKGGFDVSVPETTATDDGASASDPIHVGAEKVEPATAASIPPRRESQPKLPPEAARTRLRWAAIALLAAAVLSLLVQLPQFLYAMSRTAVFLLEGVPAGYTTGPAGPMPHVPIPNVVGLIATVLIILGAKRMLLGTSYSFAFVAAVLALVPTSFCFVLTVPFGIWALIVLRNPDVRRLLDPQFAQVISQVPPLPAEVPGLPETAPVSGTFGALFPATLMIAACLGLLGAGGLFLFRQAPLGVVKHVVAAARASRTLRETDEVDFYPRWGPSFGRASSARRSRTPQDKKMAADWRDKELQQCQAALRNMPWMIATSLLYGAAASVVLLQWSRQGRVLGSYPKVIWSMAASGFAAAIAGGLLFQAVDGEWDWFRYTMSRNFLNSGRHAGPSGTWAVTLVLAAILLLVAVFQSLRSRGEYIRTRFATRVIAWSGGISSLAFALVLSASFFPTQTLATRVIGSSMTATAQMAQSVRHLTTTGKLAAAFLAAHGILLVFYAVRLGSAKPAASETPKPGA